MSFSLRYTRRSGGGGQMFSDFNSPAWKHACGYLESYISATEKVHKAHAKEYEKILKVSAIIESLLFQMPSSPRSGPGLGRKGANSLEIECFGPVEGGASFRSDFRWHRRTF